MKISQAEFKIYSRILRKVWSKFRVLTRIKIFTVYRIRRAIPNSLSSTYDEKVVQLNDQILRQFVNLSNQEFFVTNKGQLSNTYTRLCKSGKFRNFLCKISDQNIFGQSQGNILAKCLLYPNHFDKNVDFILSKFKF